MDVLHEKVVLAGNLLEIIFSTDHSYLLRYGNLVEYRNGMKKIRGRKTPYEFRSVEQLRYDFERDVEAA